MQVDLTKLVENAINQPEGEAQFQVELRAYKTHSQAPCGWAHVNTLGHAAALVRLYIEAFNLGSRDWAGGWVRNRAGTKTAKVSYNGLVWTPDGKREVSVC